MPNLLYHLPARTLSDPCAEARVGRTNFWAVSALGGRSGAAIETMADPANCIALRHQKTTPKTPPPASGKYPTTMSVSLRIRHDFVKNKPFQTQEFIA